MSPPNHARRVKQRIQQKEKKARRNTIFTPSSSLQTARLPPHQKPRANRRHNLRTLPNLAALGTKAKAQIKIWRGQMPTKGVKWRGLNKSFSEFIGTSGYFEAWKRGFVEGNVNGKVDVDVDDVEIRGWYVRAAEHWWQSWIPNEADREIFEENGWVGEGAEEEALLMALRRAFVEQDIGSGEMELSLPVLEERERVEGTLNDMDSLQVTGLAGRGEDKEEALSMLECLNAFGMNEGKEDIEMKGM